MLALQVDQQIDHLGLDRDVERRYRLVAHDEVRPERQRPRDADALALAAGELVRIVQHLIRPEPDLLEQFGDPFPLFVTRGHAMDGERLGPDVARPLAWCERGERVLKNDLHRTPVRAQLGLAEMGDIAAIEPDGAGGRLDEAQDAARNRRFAAAGLADKPERFSDAQREADAIDRMHGADLAAKDAASHRIVLHQIRYLEQSAGVAHGGPAISAARQHAAKWFSPQACNGGYSSRQRPIASSQRGANAQPFGRLVNEGTMPGISTRRASAFAPGKGTVGIEAIRPRV